VRPWLAYVGAFACVGVALWLALHLAFDAIMTGLRVSEAGLVLFAVIIPAVAGYSVFGFCYSGFTGHRLTFDQWLYLFALLAGALIVGISFAVTGVLPGLLVLADVIAALFFGGAAILLQRAGG